MAVRRRPVKRQLTDRPQAFGELEVEEAAPVAVAEFAAVSLGGAEDGPTRYGGMLGDSRLNGPSRQTQRIELVRQLQRQSGNAQVARLIARVQSGGPAPPGLGLLQRDCPAPAVERPPVAPAEHSGFASTAGKVKQVAAKEKQHPPATTKAAEAQAAAQGPANEVASQAAAGQVTTMAAQQPGVFNKKAFVEAVRVAIAAATPKNLDEADKYKSSGKAGQVKSQVAGLVKSGKDGAEQDIKEATKAPPDPAGAKPKPVAPMKPEQAGAEPGGVGASSAMPKPAPADEVTLKHDQCQTADQMKEAGVTEQQLARSNEPQFQDALAAKKEADAHTSAAPAAYRAEEQSTLDAAKTGASGAAANQVGGMHAGKVGALAQVAAQKAGAKAKDEASRAKVAADLEAIYGRTKADVTKILDGLDSKVNTAFDTGEKAAREAMENHIDSKTTDFKLKRYLLMPGGSLLWIKDQFSKPPELDAIIDQGVKLFTGKMDAVIDGIADIIGRELTAAKARIAQGRQEIQQHVASLPKELQSVGKEAAAGIEEKFDGLDSDVDAKRDSLVDSLAEKYVAARDAADERAQAMRDANKGLWEKAKDAVGGVIETIKKLKEMLLGVLAKAGAAIDKIIADPIQFLSNLVGAVKLGLNQFVSNIGAHLKKGLMGWLFGTLAEAGIQMPETFDLKGILGLVLQLLGLTYQNLRARAVKVVGEPTVAALEKTAEVFKLLITEGPVGLWKFIKDKLASLKDQMMEQIKEFIITKVITAGITWLISLLNPASAFVKACKMIYDVVMFFVERGSQIMSLVNAILDGIHDIASGALSGAANMVEQALSKAVPIAISFLASLLGLGGIADKIKKVIEAIQAPVNKAIDSVVGGALKLFKKIGGDKVIKAAQKGVAWTKEKIKKGKEWVKKKATQAKQWVKGKFYGGTNEEKQRRLTEGVMAGKAAVERFAGKTVGKHLLGPLLAGLRLRYRLPVLEPVQQGEFWAVHGEISRMTVSTSAKAAKAGDADKYGITRAQIEQQFGYQVGENYLFALTSLDGKGVWYLRRKGGTTGGAAPQNTLVDKGGRYEIEHHGPAGSFKLAPGGFSAHEGQKILTATGGSRQIHLISKHGPGAAMTRLGGVVATFHQARTDKVKTWNDTIAIVNGRITKWTAQLASATGTAATELTTKITNARAEIATLTGKIAHVTGIKDDERDKIQDFLFNEAKRRDVPFRETQFQTTDILEQTVLAALRDNQAEIDNQLIDSATKAPKPNGTLTANPIKQRFRNNVGVGYELDPTMKIVPIGGDLKQVSVTLVVSDSTAMQYKVLTAFPVP